MSHIAEPWFLLKGELPLGGSVGRCVRQRASKRVALERTCPGGQESGLHLSPSASVPGCLGFGFAGLCSLLASGRGFLGQRKPPSGRTQPFPLRQPASAH